MSESPTELPSVCSESEDCAVCGKPADGCNFGVYSCRACAAFFRRCVVLRKSYKCKKGDGGCQMNGNQRALCRYCRYDKCLEAGMKIENIQRNRDVLKTSEQCKRKPIEEIPFFENRFSDFIQAHMEELKCRSFTVFNKSRTKRATDESALMIMHSALIQHRSNQKYTIKFIQVLDVDFLFSMWKDSAFRMAEWYMNCDEFASLNLEDKFLIFTNTCGVWKNLERAHMSVELFGERLKTERIFLHNDEFAMNMDTITLDISSCSEYDSEYWKRMVVPIMDRNLEETVRPMITMQITTVELAYILCQVAFHVEGIPVSDDALRKMTEFRDKISDGLHVYYSQLLNIANYADRLIQLMRLTQTAELAYMEKKKMMDLAQLFDVLKIDAERTQ